MAYAFLRNKPYQKIEPKVTNEPDWDRVKKLVQKYCTIEWSVQWTAAKSGAITEEQYKSIDNAQIVRDNLERFEKWKSKQS